ncbi:hypothetical protein Tco_1385640 [Tanacetum coccineum]
MRALDPKWREKVTAVEESKYLSSLSLDELIGNFKVHEMIMEKDSQLVRDKKEKIKSLVSKAKKEATNDETSTSESEDEEYVKTVKTFRKFIRRRDAEIQITLSENVQNCPDPKIKRPLLEARGAIAMKKIEKRQRIKFVLWRMHQIRPDTRVGTTESRPRKLENQAAADDTRGKLLTKVSHLLQEDILSDLK